MLGQAIHERTQLAHPKHPALRLAAGNGCTHGSVLAWGGCFVTFFLSFKWTLRSDGPAGLNSVVGLMCFTLLK